MIGKSAGNCTINKNHMKLTTCYVLALTLVLLNGWEIFVKMDSDVKSLDALKMASMNFLISTILFVSLTKLRSKM